MGRIGLLGSNCKKANGGTTVEMLLICADELGNKPRTVAEVNAAVGTYVPAPGDRVRIGEAFTYKGTAKFTKFKAIVDTGKVDFETVGDAFFEALNNMASLEVINATDDAVREFIEDINSCACGHILLVKMDNGDYAEIGNIDNPSNCTAKGSSGQKSGDRNSATLEFKDTSGKIYRTYPKALALSIHPDL